MVRENDLIDVTNKSVGGLRIRSLLERSTKLSGIQRYGYLSFCEWQDLRPSDYLGCDSRNISVSVNEYQKEKQRTHRRRSGSLWHSFGASRTGIGDGGHPRHFRGFNPKILPAAGYLPILTPALRSCS